jgi:hypothetical protein
LNIQEVLLALCEYKPAAKKAAKLTLNVRKFTFDRPLIWCVLWLRIKKHPTHRIAAAVE